MNKLKSIGDIREQSYLTSALNSGIKLTLMLSTSTGNSSGKNLSTLADKLSELCRIFIIDISDLIFAEDADLFSLARVEACGTRIVFSSIHNQ